MTKGHRSQYSDSGCQVYPNPMFESVLTGFCSKEAPFIFLPLTYVGHFALTVDIHFRFQYTLINQASLKQYN